MSFREPLSAIIQSCDTLLEREGVAGSESNTNTITEIRNKSRQLIQYANELLEMSNMETSMPRSAKIEVNLIELVMSYRREILYEVKPNVPVNVRTDLSPHVKVWIDTAMFRHLVMHLLRESAKHTDKGHINIRYAAENHGLRFWIENTCDFVDPEILATMFTKQIDPNNKHLGDKDAVISMSICKSIIDKLSGTIEATSRKTEQGNLLVITFWFPCSIKTS